MLQVCALFSFMDGRNHVRKIYRHRLLVNFMVDLIKVSFKVIQNYAIHILK